MKIRHVNRVRSKGRDYFYHRITGERLSGDPRTDKAAAKRAMEINAELEQKAAKEAGRPGSLTDLIATYKASPKFTGRSEKTRKDYQRYLDWLQHYFGDDDVTELDAETVYELRDTLADTPRKADYTVQVLSLLCTFALKRPRRFGLTHNPCQKIDRLSRPEGYLPWPDDVLLRATRTAYPELRWAIYMAFHSGQRGQDCAVMEWEHYDGTAINVVQQKGGVRLWVPVHPDLKAMLDSLPRPGAAILTNRSETAWTLDHLRHEIADLMAEIGAPGYTLHGLRKNAVNNLLEAGCSEHETGSITGQTPQTVRHYARRVNQKRLATAAMAKLVQNRNGT